MNGEWRLTLLPIPLGIVLIHHGWNLTMVKDYDDMDEAELRAEWDLRYPDQYVGDRIIKIVEAKLAEVEVEVDFLKQDLVLKSKHLLLLSSSYEALKKENYELRYRRD